MLQINEYYVLPSHEGDLSQFDRLNNPSVYDALMFPFSDHHKQIWVPTDMGWLLWNLPAS